MLDIYRSKPWWKFILAICGAVMLAITLIYSNYLAKKLGESERKNTAIYTEALNDILINPDNNKDYSLNDTITNAFALPVIIEYSNGNLDGINFGPGKDEDQDFLRKKVNEYLLSGKKSEAGNMGMKLYFFNSPLLTYIKYFPIVQILLVGLFVLLGYYLFSIARRAEQNRIWAGLAKETAHQLGTPISAILAWVEYLKENADGDPTQLEIATELTKDVNRLELVADRFSKIGSEPKLKKTNLHDQILRIKNYMQKRAARKIRFDFPDQLDHTYLVMANDHLLDWVLENLIRNSLDAMEGSGTIAAHIYKENNYVCLDLSDTGKGIQASKLKTVFKPGYTTKKRGWGLGLSLAKRIVENYHKGKIFVKSSRINEGTVFCIKLPEAT